MITVLMAVIVLPTSCIEEPESEIEGKGQNRFRVPSGTFSLVAFDAKPQTRTVLTIFRDANSNSALNQTASVEFELNQAALDAYNEENGTEFEILGDAYYNFNGVEGSTISFAAGDFSKDVKIDLIPEGLDFSKQYALPFVFKNPSSGYGVSATSETVIVQVTVKNQYHGTYQATGVFHHPTAGDRDISEEKELVTAGPATVEAPLGDLGGAGYYMLLTVNADNTVTIAKSGITPNINQTWGPNYYDPATKSFHLHYSYNTAAPRIIEETITLK